MRFACLCNMWYVTLEMPTQERQDDRGKTIRETAAAAEGSLDRGLRILARMIARDVMSRQAAPDSLPAGRKAVTPARDDKNISRP